ncbi:MAG: SCO family protein [Micropepsaceae bacterium]
MFRYIVVFAAALAAAPSSVGRESSGTPPVASELAQLGRGIGNATLVDDTGATMRWDELHGRPRAVFFGFTHCPVICPVTVWEIDAALKKIGVGGDKIQVVFVTLDPARDTPKVLKDYFSGFNGLVRGMTGTQTQVDRIAKAFEVSHERVALMGGDYTLDHTAAVFLLDAKGSVVDTIGYGTPQEQTVARLRRLLGAK